MGCSIFSWRFLFISFQLIKFQLCGITAYKAAVVEYEPVGDPWKEDPHVVIDKNIREYEDLIKKAASEGVDIVVFPEYGITTLKMPNDRVAAKPYLQYVGPIGGNPCLESSPVSLPQEVGKVLSCSAQLNSVYVIANVAEIRPCKNSTSQKDCPEDSVFHFNCNVAFDRNGTVVAKALKRHLYFENQFDKPTSSVRSVDSFQTDFNTTFGIFTSFDVNYYDPSIPLVEEGIRDFIFTAAWVDALPFAMSYQIQSMWAYAAHSNLLASGYHRPAGGQIGSGIFSRKKGCLNGTYSEEAGTKLIIADLETISSFRENHNHVKIAGLLRRWVREDLSNYSSLVIPLSSNQQKPETARVCSDESFCCEATLSVLEVKNSTTFRVIAFNGVRGAGDGSVVFSWQVCAILHCISSSVESCTEISSKEDFIPEMAYAKLTASGYTSLPSVGPGISLLSKNFSQIVPYSLLRTEISESNYTIETTKSITQYDIKTMAIVQRLYNPDEVKPLGS